MTLDPFLAANIAAKSNEPRVSDLGVKEARASKSASRMQLWEHAGAVETQELTIPMARGACGARLYRPKDVLGPVPLVVFLHGGGFVVCDIDTHDGLCRSISGGSGVAVLSVDYRLAPEHVFPAALDDAEAATRWAMTEWQALNINPEKVVLAGDSAGGHIAVTAALRLIEQPAPFALAGLALFYPVIASPHSAKHSYSQFSEGYGLTKKDMEWFWQHYGTAGDTEATPLVSTALGMLPSTFLITAEYDVLRDEGEEFASYLMQEGVLVTTKRCLGMNHNFMAFSNNLPAAGQVLKALRDWIK